MLYPLSDGVWSVFFRGIGLGFGRIRFNRSFLFDWQKVRSTYAGKAERPSFFGWSGDRHRLNPRACVPCIT